MMVGKEVLIINGMHEYENGRVMREDLKSYTIPFVEVHTRTKGGSFRKNRIALVPMQYCVEFNVAELEQKELAKVAEKYGADSDIYKRTVRAIEKSKSSEAPES